MIYLRITDLLLSGDITHTSTDWQVAEDKQFTNVVAEAIGDTTNLTNVWFDSSLDPEIKYYSRCRILLSTGYTAWSNIDIFTPENVDDPSFGLPMPSLVTMPEFSITNDGVGVPVYNTTISINPVGTIGNAVHESTSYLLEDITGYTVWESKYNIDDKLVKVIPANIMVPGNIYKLSILVHTDSYDTAQLVSRTISSEKPGMELIIGNLIDVSPNADLIIELDPDIPVSGVTSVLYTTVNDTLITVGTYPGQGTNSNIITVPANDLRPLTSYSIRVNTDDITKWDQRKIMTTV